MLMDIENWRSEFQNCKVEKEGLFSVIIYSYSKQLMNTPCMTDTLLEDVIKKQIGTVPSLFLTWFSEKTDHV